MSGKETNTNVQPNAPEDLIIQKLIERLVNGLAGEMRSSGLDKQDIFQVVHAAVPFLWADEDAPIDCPSSNDPRV